MKKFAVIQSIIILCFLALGAQTLIRLTTDVTGILPVANGGTAAATAAAGTVFGNLTASTAAPSFSVVSTFVANAVPLPNTRRWVTLGANGAGGGVNCTGVSYSLGESGGTSAGACIAGSATSTEPPYIQNITTTTNGNVAQEGGTISNYIVGRHPYFIEKRKLSTTATRRDWIGLTDKTAATMGASDDPAGNYASFLYSNAVGANFMCVTKDNVTQQSQSSGVLADTSWHTFAFRESAAGVYDFYIDDMVTPKCTNSTHPPTTGTAMHWNTSTTCVSCNPTAQALRFAWVYIETDF